MHASPKHPTIWRWWYVVAGPAALLWVLLRSGMNPKRLAYPCQQAAIPIAVHWFLAISGFIVGSLFWRRFARVSATVMIAAGAVWFIATLPNASQSNVNLSQSLPVWEVADPVSTVFVMDNIPPTSGSLAAGNASVPNEYLPDPAVDTLLAMMADKGTFLYRTTEHPEGIVGADNVVIIKANFQWTERNTTNTDRIKGLIWRILQHPDGFTGEILACENTQDMIPYGYSTAIDDQDNNSEDLNQSILDVVSTFSAKGYRVYCRDWKDITNEEVAEYADGDYVNGYVYDAGTKITYPKFRTPSGAYVSTRYGIWSFVGHTYDPSRLCIINFPVLKAHFWAGATVGIKNWIGLMTIADAEARFGGFNNMHNTYYFGANALVARVMAVTFPRLTIVDATWTTTDGPFNTAAVVNTDVLFASTDPAAVSWYAAKYVLTPIALTPTQTDPDLPTSRYHGNLERWTTFLRDSAGLACTMDSAAMSVYDRSIWCNCTGFGDVNGMGGINPVDVVYMVNFVYKQIDQRQQIPGCPKENGDWNCSGTVNPMDVVAYVNFVYKQTGALCNPCAP